MNSFRIEPAGQNAFARSAPLYSPRLETNEEFVAVKAKKRPVILLSPALPNPGIQEQRRGGRIYRPLCMVAPVYSLVNRHTGELKYPQEFVDRIRIMAYPEFLFLPEAPGVLHYPSYARVGELQAVYQPHLEPRNLRLREDVLRILEGQVVCLLSGTPSGDFQLYREQLLHQEDRPE